jgi:hypothetical protein
MELVADFTRGHWSSVHQLNLWVGACCVDSKHETFRSESNISKWGKTRTNGSSDPWEHPTHIGYGACMGGPKYYAVNLILRLFLYHFLHTMSSWRHKSIHNNTNNQQTPPPWWWSRSPLQRRGFDESTPSEWQAALLMFVLRPLLKGFGRINKLK